VRAHPSLSIEAFSARTDERNQPPQPTTATMSWSVPEPQGAASSTCSGLDVALLPPALGLPLPLPGRPPVLGCLARGSRVDCV
jgi:hypothetical protein